MHARALEAHGLALQKHVDDCMEHRDKVADKAERQRGDMKSEILNQLDAKHAANLISLSRQDEAIAGISTDTAEIKAFLKSVVFTSVCLLAAGLLAMILDKLGWVHLGS